MTYGPGTPDFSSRINQRLPGEAVRSGFGMGGNQLPEGYSASQMQKFGPEAMQLYERLFGFISPDSKLHKMAMGDEETFNQIEAPAKRQFQGTLGNIASRFSGMGMGARRSSGFNQASTSAAQNFSEQLQSQRHGLSQQAMKDLMSYANQILGYEPYEQMLEKDKPSDNSRWLELALALSGTVFGSAMGAPGAGYNTGRATAQYLSS